MSAWRREAIQRMPMLRQDIGQGGSFKELCGLMAEEVWEAYHRANIVGDTIGHSPEDDALLRGIHDYAGHCLLRPHDQDAFSNIVLFYESLSQNINVYIAREFYKYVEPDVFEAMRCSGILNYILDRDKPEDFVADYEAKHGSVSKKV